MRRKKGNYEPQWQGRLLIMKVRAYLILLVVVLITFIGTQANTEESIPSKDKAIGLAKECVYLSFEDGSDITAQEYAELSTKANHIFPIGWYAVDVSETMYLVVFKFLMNDFEVKDKEAAWYFHVIPKDNIAKHLVPIIKFKDRGKNIVTSELELWYYFENIKKISTYTKEEINDKLYKLLGQHLYELDAIDRLLGISKGEEP